MRFLTVHIWNVFGSKSRRAGFQFFGAFWPYFSLTNSSNMPVNEVFCLLHFLSLNWVIFFTVVERCTLSCCVFCGADNQNIRLDYLSICDWHVLQCRKWRGWTGMLKLRSHSFIHSHSAAYLPAVLVWAWNRRRQLTQSVFCWFGSSGTKKTWSSFESQFSIIPVSYLRNIIPSSARAPSKVDLKS